MGLLRILKERVRKGLRHEHSPCTMHSVFASLSSVTLWRMHKTSSKFKKKSDSDRAEMMQLSVWECVTSMINIKKTQSQKLDNMQEETKNIGKEKETRKQSKEKMIMES